MNTNRLCIPLALCSFALASGCGSSRDVEVTGEIKSASQGEVRIEVFEVTGEGADAARESALVAKVAEPGPFELTVPLEGDDVVIWALVDADGDDACTEGEEWAEVEATVKDDRIEGVTLELAPAICPSSR